MWLIDHEAWGVEPAMMGPVWGREEVASATGERDDPRANVNSPSSPEQHFYYSLGLQQQYGNFY